MEKIFAAIVILMTSVSGYGQKDKYKFAQTYVGAQLDAFGGSNSPEYMAGRLLMGGTHFWQKADFYISIPLFTSRIGGEDWHYSEGVITGFRYLPFGLSRKGPRPFIGVQWITPELRIGDGPLFETSRFGLEVGLNIVFGSFYTLELSTHHVFNNEVNYAISREGSAPIEASDFGLSIALKKYFDTTANLSSEKSKADVKQRYDGFAEEGKLSTWNVAIGLSANVSVSDVPMLEAYDFMPDRPPLTLYPDVAVGYYFHELDAGVRASWRPMKLQDEAYSLDYIIRQHRLGLEGFKFLFDYKGFVPFLGFSVGSDYIKAEINDGDLPKIQDDYSALSYGISFGWDIRPTDTEAWILRTNLRYLIQSDSNADIANATGRNLEINFIQMVIYPSRWK
ncbi:hypothetical protein O3Q51_05400 [Cryomorphaceae bacterium 1068]|nr:hypothetical protein [Cryomorphaceae bacterium 1068]